MLPLQIAGISDIRDLFQNYIFNVSIPGFCVIAGSIWFLPYYFVVILVNSIIIMVLEESGRAVEHKETYMWILLGVFVWISCGQFF